MLNRTLRAALFLAAGLLVAGTALAEVDDPLYRSDGSWGQSYDDQWAVKRIGFTDSSDSAWSVETGEGNSVIVAVIDTGVDYFHPDLARSTIWRNKAERENGIDDDEPRLEGVEIQLRDTDVLPSYVQTWNDGPGDWQYWVEDPTNPDWPYGKNQLVDWSSTGGPPMNCTNHCWPLPKKSTLPPRVTPARGKSPCLRPVCD